jgi:CrcB protein
MIQVSGYTTFSTFAHETLAMTRDGELVRALINVSLQVILALTAALLGYQLARTVL